MNMVVGICTIELNIPGVSSLKEKRSHLKSLKARLHREFNVSVAEIALHDVWQSSTIGVGVVSTAVNHAENVLENVVRWIERHRPDLDVIDYGVVVEHW